MFILFIMKIKAKIVALVCIFSLVAMMSGCKESSSVTTNTDAEKITTVKIVSKPPLLTDPLQTVQLEAKAYDKNGKEIATTFEWQSSRPDMLAVEPETGLVSAASLGSAKISVQATEHCDANCTSFPVVALFAQLKADIVQLSDHHFATAPVLESPDLPYGVGSRIIILLTGYTDPIQVGDIFAGTEDIPVGGRVVDYKSVNNQIEVTLEVVSLDEVFLELNIDTVFDSKEIELKYNKDVVEKYNITKNADGSISFNAKPIERTLRAAIGTRADPNHPFKCKFTPDGFDASNAPIKLDLASPSFTLNHSLSLPLKYTSENGLEKLAVKGTISAELKLKTSIALAVEVKMECTLELTEINLPLPGLVGLFVGLQVPIGVGMELGGKFKIIDVGIELSGKGQVTAEYGYYNAPDCSTQGGLEGNFGQGLSKTCGFDGSISFTGETKSVVDAPDYSQFSNDFTLEPAVRAFAYASIQVGNEYFDDARIELLVFQGGAKQSLNLATKEGQISKSSYKSDYKLESEVLGKPGSTVEKALKIFGKTTSVLKPEIKITHTLAISPQLLSFSVSTHDFKPGDQVEFFVNLKPETVNYLPFIYNVDEIFIYRMNGDDAEELTSVTAHDGETSFTLSWVAEGSAEVGEKIYAFVTTPLLPIDLLGALELGDLTYSNDKPIAAVVSFSNPSQGINTSHIEVWTAGQIGPVDLDSTWQTDPAFSPDGNSLAYSAIGDNDDFWKIHIVNLFSGSPRLLGGFEKNDGTYGWAPTWSSDGTQLAYLYDNDTASETIRFVNANTGALSHSCPVPDFAYDLAWSPDGLNIAYARYEGDPNGYNSLHVMNVQSCASSSVASSSHNQDPNWSTDSQTIIFDRFGGSTYNVYRVGVDGSNFTRLATNARSPAYNTNGNKIIFTRGGNIYQMNADGTNQELFISRVGSGGFVDLDWKH